MPNAVLKIDKAISDLKNIELFENGRGVFLYSAVLGNESFFMRLSQKQNKVVVKLEKTTMPKITSSLKEFMLEFAQKIAKELNGEILHHNLNISKATDYKLYEKYEIKLEDINKTDWINSLCEKKTISLEIGMGAGEFLTKQAENFKSECFIGVEILNNDFHTALRRFDRAKIDNIKAVYYDARAVLDRFQDNSLKRVYINFPEPWFRTKKIKHSILTRKTAQEIENILKEDGELIIITDNHPFAVSAAAILEPSTSLKKVYKHPFVVSQENIKTKYEKKWIRYERTIYKLQYKKTSATSTKNHQTLNFPIKIAFENITTDDYVFKVLNIYKNSTGKKIIEIAIGYSKNPQHIFFSLKANNLIDLLPQSRFIVNSDFLKAIEL